MLQCFEALAIRHLPLPERGIPPVEGGRAEAVAPPHLIDGAPRIGFLQNGPNLRSGETSTGVWEPPGSGGYCAG